MRKAVIAALQLGTVLLSCAFAQQASAPSAVSDKDINLLRKDPRSAQKQIIALNVPLTDAGAQKFLPVYEQYNAERLCCKL